MQPAPGSMFFVSNLWVESISVPALARCPAGPQLVA
jgi:hypothetical protein